MKGHKRSRYAQNRIEYIVFNNPKGAGKLVHEYGYIPPKNLLDLAETVKLLVKKRGKVFIKDLIKIHPEKEVILMASGHSDYDNYCGGCHSAYTGNSKKFMDTISEKSRDELEDLYDDIKEKANDSPENDEFREQLNVVWDIIQEKKEEKKKKEEEKSSLKVPKEWAFAGVALIVGIIIGSVRSSS